MRVRAWRSNRIPIISGQSETYLVESLRAFAEEWRASGMMELAAVETDRSLWQDLARHFASQARVSAPAPASGGQERGREIAHRGIPENGVPACLGCHDSGNRNPIYPTLGGQHAGYLQNQLQLFATGKRGGTSYQHLMAKVAKGLSAEDMRDVAAYFSSRYRR